MRVCLRLFHGDSGFVRIREMFELGGVELERVHCNLKGLPYRKIIQHHQEG